MRVSARKLICFYLVFLGIMVSGLFPALQTLKANNTQNLITCFSYLQADQDKEQAPVQSKTKHCVFCTASVNPVAPLAGAPSISLPHTANILSTAFIEKSVIRPLAMRSIGASRAPPYFS